MKDDMTKELVDKDLTQLLKYCTEIKPSTQDEIDARSVTLGAYTKHKTLVLDMDETLLHARLKGHG